MATPPLPRGRGSLPGVSAPTSRAPASPWLPPAPRNLNCARGLSGWLSFTLQPRTRRPGEPRPLTRPHHGGDAAATGHPQNGINERELEGRHQRARRRGPEIGSGCVRVRLWAPGPSQEGGDAAERGCRLPGARLHAEAQVGGEEGAGREEGSLTRFSALLGARRLGRVTLRPASGLDWSGLPYTLLRVPASRIQVTRRRPRPAPPLCATLRFPQSRLPCRGVTSGARPKALPPSLRAHWMEL